MLTEVVASLGNAESLPACFAVPGHGPEALDAAHDVLVGGQPPAVRFDAGEPISVVFFSRPFGSFVHLREAVAGPHAVSLRYRLVPHRTRQMTTHVALVPVEPAPGVFQIETRRQEAPTGGLPAPAASPDVVCGSAQIEIRARRAP